MVSQEKEIAKLQAQVERLMMIGGGGTAQQDAVTNSSVRALYYELLMLWRSDACH